LYLIQIHALLGPFDPYLIGRTFRCGCGGGGRLESSLGARRSVPANGHSRDQCVAAPHRKHIRFEFAPELSRILVRVRSRTLALVLIRVRVRIRVRIRVHIRIVVRVLVSAGIRIGVATGVAVSVCSIASSRSASIGIRLGDSALEFAKTSLHLFLEGLIGRFDWFADFSDSSKFGTIRLGCVLQSVCIRSPHFQLQSDSKR